jgi:hypothetical protein
MADRRGILLVGPSGAGKTSLMNAITNRNPPVLKSTTEIDTRFVILAKTMVAIHDAPGHYVIAAEEINESVERHQPTILVVVLANGFLDSVVTGNALARPNKPLEPTVEEYLKKARDEELEWIKLFTDLVHVPKHLVKYVVLVVNKMDLWSPEQAAVEKRYGAGREIDKALAGLVKKLAIPGQTCQVTYAAATVDMFKARVPPQPPFNRQAATDSLRVLKAFFTTLLLDGRV